VLRLLASGATDVQIAAWLSLSPATVQTHVRNAKAKLGARTRAQAVALALQRGMIRPG
jgi:DNA-binding CsgD family transcriptional regulator